MTTVVIHPATKVYLDYGSELEREHGVILEFNGTLMRFQSRKRADAVLADWQRELAASTVAHHFSVTMGEHITCKCDLNPHGLM